MTLAIENINQDFYVSLADTLESAFALEVAFGLVDDMDNAETKVLRDWSNGIEKMSHHAQLKDYYDPDAKFGFILHGVLYSATADELMQTAWFSAPNKLLYVELENEETNDIFQFSIRILKQDVLHTWKKGSQINVPTVKIFDTKARKAIDVVKYTDEIKEKIERTPLGRLQAMVTINNVLHLEDSDYRKIPIQEGDYIRLDGEYNDDRCEIIQAKPFGQDRYATLDYIPIDEENEVEISINGIDNISLVIPIHKDGSLNACEVRIVIEGEWELTRWEHTEWADDSIVVMSAILGAFKQFGY